MTESRINVRIPPEKKDAFQRKVESQGKKVTDVILEMIEQYLKEETPIQVIDLAKRVERLEQEILGESAA